MIKYIQWLCVMCMLMLPTISPSQEWVERYNGTGNGEDRAQDVAVDNSGNVYVTGPSMGSGTDFDYATVKYDSLGNEKWAERYDGPGNGRDWAQAIAVDNSGYVYVTGLSMGSGTDFDYATVKYDSLGNEKWAERYDGPVQGHDWAGAIAVDNSGNVYVTGLSLGSGTHFDYVTVKYDSLGEQQWETRYNGPGNGEDDANAIAVDNLGYVYVTGASIGSGAHFDYATVRYDSLGNEKWAERYNGPGNGEDRAQVIAVDNSGYLYVTGASMGSGTDFDYATVKYDSLGEQQWEARYDGLGSGRDWANAIVVDNSGNVYVTGESMGSGTDIDYATVKYDSLGEQQWVARYNGQVNGQDWAGAIAIDDSGNVYVTGLSLGSGTDFDYLTVKYDSLGEQQWETRYNGPGNGEDDANAIAVDNSGYLYVTGASMGSGTGFDYATIKYAQSDGIAEERATSVENSYLGATILSGPLQLPEGKKCKVFDIMGRIAEPTNITRGIYFIEVDGKVIQKVIKIR